MPAAAPPPEQSAPPQAPFLLAAMANLGIDLSPGGPTGEVTRTAEAVADLEFAVRTHELFNRWFAWSLKLHIVRSLVFYVLLGLHIWAGIYFGLRWWS